MPIWSSTNGTVINCPSPAQFEDFGRDLSISLLHPKPNYRSLTMLYTEWRFMFVSEHVFVCYRQHLRSQHKTPTNIHLYTCDLSLSEFPKLQRSSVFISQTATSDTSEDLRKIESNDKQLSLEIA
nr:hypothetical protein HmN_000455400 [Hymenolepis microstoma]